MAVSASVREPPRYRCHHLGWILPRATVPARWPLWTGPRHVDVDVVKHLFPTDPLIDFVYRTEMANYSRLDNQPHITDKWGVSEMLYRAIVAQDWNVSRTAL